MDWTRSLFGIGNGSSSPKAPPPKPNGIVERHQASKESPEEKLAKLERAQEMQLKKLRHKLAQADKTASTATGPALKEALLQRRTLTTQIESHMAKLANTRAQRRITETAASNIQQALVMKDVAAALKDTTATMETIDVASTMDDVKESAAVVADFNAELGTPLELDGPIDMDDVDAEIEAEMERRAAALLDDAPTAVYAQHQQPPPSGPTTPVVSAKPAVSESVN